MNNFKRGMIALQWCLILLKLFGVFPWSWWWVLSPAIAGGVFVLLVIIMLVILAAYHVVDK